jgi:ureidoacrylate peracid hydrolase
MEVILEARPEPLKIEPERTALVVVDMQNAFCSKGGMFDTLGMLNEARVEPVVEKLQGVIASARKAHLKIVYLRMGYRPDLADAGGPGSPNYWKEESLVAARKNPASSNLILVEGSPDWQIIDALKPQAGDLIVNKNRYSGFPHTDLDIVLKTQNLKYLVFGGLFTNVCVESTIRDAYFHEYFPVLVSDCCGNIGPDYTQDATLWAVSHIFGWVTDASALTAALDQAAAASG